MPAANNAAAPVFHPPHDVTAQGRALVSQTSAWLSDNWLQVLIAFGIAAAIVAVLLGAQKALCRLARDNADLVGWREIVSRMAARTRLWFLVVVAARLVDGYAEAPPLVDKTIGFLFTIGLTFQAALWARELAVGFIEHRAGDGNHAGSALSSAMGIIRVLISFAIFSIALILVLGNLGVNVAGLVAGLGVGGIAIGLAAQGIFADLFAGISILFDRPFRIGEVISYGDTMGTVEMIGMKSTRIRAFTGELIYISNKKLLDNEIRNVSVRSKIRLSFSIGVTYETPPEKLKALPAMLRELAEGLEFDVPRSGFEAFGASSLDFTLLVETPGSDWPRTHAARDALLVAIMTRFAGEGINMAYPTQTTYTAAPDGTIVMPYPEVQPVRQIEATDGAKDARA